MPKRWVSLFGVVLVCSASPLVLAQDNVDIYANAIVGERLDPLVPASLGGVSRTNVLQQAYASGGAYRVSGMDYANLDIQNVFFPNPVRDRRARCTTWETIGSHRACFSTAPRPTLWWEFSERLTVTLSAPTEELLRRMARDLNLDAIAALARDQSPPPPMSTSAR